MILFINNQTASWLRAKPIEEVQELMKKAHSKAPEFKYQYEERICVKLESNFSGLNN